VAAAVDGRGGLLFHLAWFGLGFRDSGRCDPGVFAITGAIICLLKTATTHPNKPPQQTTPTNHPNIPPPPTEHEGILCCAPVPLGQPDRARPPAQQAGR